MISYLDPQTTKIRPYKTQECFVMYTSFNFIPILPLFTPRAPISASKWKWVNVFICVSQKGYWLIIFSLLYQYSPIPFTFKVFLCIYSLCLIRHMHLDPIHFPVSSYTPSAMTTSPTQKN